MPNWCECDLIVTGDDGEIARFLADTDCLKFSKLIPYPEEYAKADAAARAYGEEYWRLTDDEKAARGLPSKNGFNSGGSEWCCEHWGTQWERDFDVVEQKAGRTKLSGATAWSSPLPVIAAVSERYPTLKFDLRYFERGMGFKGRLVTRAGQALEKMTGVYRGSRGG